MIFSPSGRIKSNLNLKRSKWHRSKGVGQSDHEDGVIELISRLLENGLKELEKSRHWLPVGSNTDGSLFCIDPCRNGILLSGVSGGGKTTFTATVIECLIKNSYQFCLIDPEGDYLELGGAQIIGNEISLPTIEEIITLLKEPEQNFVNCILSIPLNERTIYFAEFLMAFSKIRYELGHPHWLLLDEAHHLLPADSGPDSYPVPEDFKNIMLTTTSVDKLSHPALSKTGMVMIVGDNWNYPIKQYARILNIELPALPSPVEGHMQMWDRENQKDPVQVNFSLPQKLLRRHKRKYAQGDMGSNSFVFTGTENKLHLVANGVVMFKHLAEGIDSDRWQFHFKRNDYSNWFRSKVYDEELARISELADAEMVLTVSTNTFSYELFLFLIINTKLRIASESLFRALVIATIKSRSFKAAYRRIETGLLGF